MPSRYTISVYCEECEIWIVSLEPGASLVMSVAIDQHDRKYHGGKPEEEEEHAAL